MKNRGRSFVVEVRARKPNADYASKPGDARRSGHVGAVGLMPVHVEFFERSEAIWAQLGVVVVGAVTHDVASKGYFWAVYLPGMPQTPKPARDAEAGRRAILRKVREWCEAAKLMTVRGR